MLCRIVNFWKTFLCFCRRKFLCWVWSEWIAWVWFSWCLGKSRSAWRSLWLDGKL